MTGSRVHGTPTKAANHGEVAQLIGAMAILGDELPFVIQIFQRTAAIYLTLLLRLAPKGFSSTHLSWQKSLPLSLK